jgi:N-acetylneuraminic acid mutarotase
MGLSTCTVNGKIYAIGGYPAGLGAAMTTVEAYDPATDTWQSKAPMPTPRGRLCATAVNGKIFAIGASTPPSGPWLATVEMYDPLTDTWARRANTPTAKGVSAASTVHGLIYVIGGRSGSTGFSTVEEYDPVTNTRTRRTSMPGQRFSLGASEVNGRIYAIGGASAIPNDVGLSLVYEYTPPILPPLLHMTLIQSAGPSVLRLEWPSRSDCYDRLQTRSQLQPGGWTDLERFSGTGETLTKETAATEPATLYRLQRELR